MSVVVKSVAAVDDSAANDRPIEGTAESVGEQLLHKFQNAIDDESFCPETRNALRNALTSISREDQSIPNKILHPQCEELKFNVD